MAPMKKFTPRYVKKKSPYKKKSPTTTPGRFSTNYRTYKKTYKISKQMTNYGETIYKAMNHLNEVTPTAQLGTTKTFSLAYTLGDTPPTGWTNFNALGGMQITQGTGTNERVGQWAYLKKGHATLTIDMKPNTTTSGVDIQPCVFRVILFKAKPGSRNFGLTYSPGTSLFYNTSGQEIGLDSSGVNGDDMQLQPLNRRRWTIFCDKKFTLTAPTSVDGHSTSFYSSRKVIPLEMPFYKKCRYATSSQEPQDIDIHYGILVIATPIAKFSAGNRWELSLRGTVTANDS